MFFLRIGDICLTRNAGGEKQNPSPGHYNHAAIVVPGGIVEAQAHVVDGRWSDDRSAPGMVIVSGAKEFWGRYPAILVRRLDGWIPQQLAAERAIQLVGTPYWKASSVFRFLRKSERGMNCVAVVRDAVAYAVHYDPGWRRPDHLSASTLLYTVFEKPLEEGDSVCFDGV